MQRALGQLWPKPPRVIAEESQSPQPILPSHLSGDHTHHNMKYFERLLDSSLATIAVIQASANTLADVLTPRAYNTLKALYALAALDAASSSTNPKGSEIDDSLYSSSSSSLLPKPVPCNGKVHISISGLCYASFVGRMGDCLLTSRVFRFLGFGSQECKQPF